MALKDFEMWRKASRDLVHNIEREFEAEYGNIKWSRIHTWKNGNAETIIPSTESNVESNSSQTTQITTTEKI